MFCRLLLFFVIVIVLFILKCKSTEFVRKLQKKKEVFIENASFSYIYNKVSDIFCTFADK